MNQIIDAGINDALLNISEGNSNSNGKIIWYDIVIKDLEKLGNETVDLYAPKDFLRRKDYFCEEQLNLNKAKEQNKPYLTA
jgi:hypothetical protein